MKLIQSAIIFCFFVSTCANGHSAAKFEPERNGDLKNTSSLVKCWEINNENIQSFASDNESILIQDRDGQIISIDKENKQELWRILIGDKSLDSLRIIANRIYIISIETETKNEKENKENKDESNKEGKVLTIRKINSDSGIIEDTTRLFQYDDTEYLITQDSQILSFLRDGQVTLAELFGNKNITWDRSDAVRDKDQFFYQLSGDYYLAVIQNKLVQYKISDGSLVRELVSEKSNISAVLIDDDNSVIWGDVSGKVFYYDSKNGSNKKILRAGGKISWLKEFGNHLIIASDDNFIQNISSKSKKIIWKKRLSGRISLEPGKFGDSIILTTSGENEIYFLDENTGKLVNQIMFGDTEFIEDFQLSGNSLLVLTNRKLYKFQENCSSK